MARKARKRRSNVRSASKVQERELLEAARFLRDNPGLAAPECADGCVWFSPIKRARKHVRKAHAARDDPDRLKKLAKRGNKLGRAYAAVLLLAHGEEIPYLAQANLPWGKVSYAVRGTAPAHYHIGLQHRRDPRTRLLAVKDYVKGRGLHVYAVGEGMVCTGKRPHPPEAFVDARADELGVKGTGAERPCPHGGAGDGRAGVDLHWKSAGVTFSLCHRCLDEGSALHRILERVAAPKPWTDFDVAVHLAPLEYRGSEDDDFSAPPAEAPGDALDAYLRGGLGDRELLRRAEAHRREQLRRRDGLTLVAGDVAYGAHRDAFIDALHPTDVERAALQGALAGYDRPLVLDKPTATRALEELWPERGLAALEAVTGDADLAARLHGDAPDPDAKAIAKLLPRAAKAGEHARVEGALPTYKGLPEALALADAVARAYRTGGRDAALQRIRDDKLADGKARGLAWAFTRALDAHEGAQWKFSRVDKELGDAVHQEAERLLEAEAEDYHGAMARLATAGGFGDAADVARKG